MADRADSVLALRVGESVLGVRLWDIREIIIPTSEMMRAPTFPECLLGIINVRGRVAPIVNTWLLLGESEPVDKKSAVLCLCEHSGELYCFMVDELMDTIEDFDEYEPVGDDSGKSRLFPVSFRLVGEAAIGLIKTKELYAAAREIASQGSGFAAGGFVN